MIVPLLVLAVLQGLLEFLPVSSEGQILLVSVVIFNIDAATALSLIFWLHLGTAFTVIMFYRKDIFGPIYSRLTHSLTNATEPAEHAKPIFGPLFRFVLLGTIGTIIIALPLYFFLASLVPYLVGGIVSIFVGILLIVTGGVLYFQRGTKGELELEDITWKEAFVLGLVQGFAVLPGISRSGMTLTWLLVRGVRRDDALRLSFLLGVPATFGVVALDLLFGSVLWTLPLYIASIVLVAFLTGLGSLFLLRYSALKVPWWIFCLALGCIVVVLSIPAVLGLPSIGIP